MNYEPPPADQVNFELDYWHPDLVPENMRWDFDFASLEMWSTELELV